MPLLKVGELPPTRRGRTGRKLGTWRGHEEEAKQLRHLAKTHPGQWAMLATQLTASRAQQIAAGIKNGTAADFPRTDEGKFNAAARASEDQSPVAGKVNGKGEPVVVYDVWARFEPTGVTLSEAS